MAHKNKKSTLNLKSVFMNEGHLDKLQGIDVETPRNVFIPDTSTNDNLVPVAGEDSLEAGQNALGAIEEQCACGGQEEMEASPAGTIIIKIGHHADELEKNGHNAINIGRIGAPGGPSLGTASTVSDDGILYDNEEDSAVMEASMVGATGGPSKEGSVLLTDEDEQLEPDMGHEDELVNMVVDPGYSEDSMPMHNGYSEYMEDMLSGEHDSFANDWKPRFESIQRKLKEGFYDTTRESSDKIKDILRMASRVLKALDEKRMSLGQAEKLLNSLLYKMYDIGINEVEEEAGYNTPSSLN